MEATQEGVRKKKNGQSGSDGNNYLRTHRIELRVCQHELLQIEQLAKSSGYSNLAQYLRESGLTRKHIESPSNRKRERDKWIFQINKCGVNINQISRLLNSGHKPDDEILMVLLQIREMVDEVHAVAKRSINEEGK